LFIDCISLLHGNPLTHQLDLIFTPWSSSPSPWSYYWVYSYILTARNSGRPLQGKNWKRYNSPLIITMAASRTWTIRQLLAEGVTYTGSWKNFWPPKQ